MDDTNTDKITKPKVEKIMSNGVEVEKTTYPNGDERIVVLNKKSKVKSNNSK